jgi:hypothetical protein
MREDRKDSRSFGCGRLARDRLIDFLLFLPDLFNGYLLLGLEERLELLQTCPYERWALGFPLEFLVGEFTFLSKLKKAVYGKHQHNQTQ